MIENIGFMQGRLSPLVDRKIQAFPWGFWRNEIPCGKNIGFNVMEWTLDQERLYENPLMTISGQKEIVSLCDTHNFSIPSLTGDCFMQAPFWKVGDAIVCNRLKTDFSEITKACSNVGIKLVVIPLVDNGSLESRYQENVLVNFLQEQESVLKRLCIRIAFESDFCPHELNRFINRLNPDVFGINYDIGNSASLGFDPVEEFTLFGNRILNVHVKDRVLGGTTVPLGEGDADFKTVYRLLQLQNYNANYILQTARDPNGQHKDVLKKYKNFVEKWSG